eukprot:CAMPEP_0202052286 /NCGR_PEP_ID=MMETSP0963-20130614/5145_1 /ASSEMBLY_ACC=CAM_ASM_000494 /TAXON_ID=4773 /ORGANISM="Schizochytrium aggregatum, Strain ATCC28209" /LENGTH=182 /DNA_ID=CAMNT_0048617529 /DNA_START=463 /DNA_END=1012 /DNA_ORIENTATION=-
MHCISPKTATCAKHGNLRRGRRHLPLAQAAEPAQAALSLVLHDARIFASGQLSCELAADLLVPTMQHVVAGFLNLHLAIVHSVNLSVLTASAERRCPLALSYIVSVCPPPNRCASLGRRALEMWRLVDRGGDEAVNDGGGGGGGGSVAAGGVALVRTRSASVAALKTGGDPEGYGKSSWANR